MRTAQFVWLVVMASIAIILAFSVVVLSAVNDSTQQSIQTQQVALNNGILGPQGQQITSAILQDMANASADDRELRLLLKRYGYTVQSGMPTNAPVEGSAASTATKARDEVGHE